MIKNFLFPKTWFLPEADRRADVFIITQNCDVPRGRFELPRVAPPAPKAGASAHFATSAKKFLKNSRSLYCTKLAPISKTNDEARAERVVA